MGLRPLYIFKSVSAKIDIRCQNLSQILWRLIMSIAGMKIETTNNLGRIQGGARASHQEGASHQFAAGALGHLDLTVWSLIRVQSAVKWQYGMYGVVTVSALTMCIITPPIS